METQWRGFGFSRQLITASCISLWSLAAVAVPPQMGAGYNYDGWTVSGGTIDSSASCTAPGVSACKTLSQDKGFLQEEVFLDNGQHYIRVLMTEPNATGDPALNGNSANLSFATETFTPFLTNSECSSIAGTLPNGFQDCQGLAAKQVVRDLTTGFESTATVQRNFPKSLAEPNLDGAFNIELSQTIDTIDPATGLAFKSGFDYTQYTAWECDISGTCANSTEIGKKMDISETVFMDPLDATKKQEFRQGVRTGWKGRQSGGFFKSAPIVATDSVVLGGRTINGITTGTPTSLSWTDTASGGGGWGWGGGSKKANDIKTTWIASNVVDGFNYQDFSLNDGTTLSSDKALLLDMQGLGGAPLDPFTWTTDPANLGPKPVF